MVKYLLFHNRTDDKQHTIQRRATNPDGAAYTESPEETYLHLASQLNISRDQIQSITIDEPNMRVTITLRGISQPSKNTSSSSWNEDIAKFTKERDQLVAMVQAFHKKATTKTGRKLFPFIVICCAKKNA